MYTIIFQLNKNVKRKSTHSPIIILKYFNVVF